MGRRIHRCHTCRTRYLPPPSMRYEAMGLDASFRCCSRCQTAPYRFQWQQYLVPVRELALLEGMPQHRQGRLVGPGRRIPSRPGSFRP